MERLIPVKKVNSGKRIVFGEVYVPMELDTDKEAMTYDEIEKLAHSFLVLSRKIDVQHEEEIVEAYPVESFIARKGDLEFTEGAWVLAVKVVDEDLWGEIERGERAAFSFSARTTKRSVLAHVDPETNKIQDIIGEIK